MADKRTPGRRASACKAHWISPRLLALCCLATVLTLAGVLLLGSEGPRPDPTRAASAGAARKGGGLPLYFTQNRGQTDRRARYYVQGRDASIFFTRRGLALSLADRTRADRRWGLRLDFLGTRGLSRPRGLGRTSAVVSHFKGRQRDWKAGLPTYSKVAYRDVWPGVDLVYSGTGGRLKYSFLVEPGADPSAIRLAWRGAKGVEVNERGQLEVSTSARTLRDDAPRSYQRVGGRRVAVQSSYGLGPGHSYGFRLGSYDRSRPLVIDPAVLVYAGYVGGGRDEQANNVALDRRGNLYVTGVTTSGDFPAKVGPDTSFNDTSGLDDAFVAKVDPSGRRLVYAGYIGGSKRDNAINIAVDRSGAAYVDGSTSSSQADGFPVKAGPDTTYNGGPQDAWLTKVRPDGRGLVYSGYIGGAGPGDPGGNNEQANGLAVDRAGNAYVAGFTSSDETTFPDGDGFGPALRGFDQTIGAAFPGLLDAFVVKVRPGGSGLEYATYVGGEGVDAGTGLALDVAGNAHVNVFTGSTSGPGLFGGFPATSGSFDTTFNGPPGPPIPNDAAAVKLNPSGTALVYATYIGGAGEEQPFGNAVDRAGNVYVTGRTSSDQSTFPDGDGFGGVPGFDQVLNAGPAGDPVPEDTFVAKLNRSGSRLAYATYIGGAAGEQSVAIDLDRDGRAHVFGTTSSRQDTFPARRGPDRSFNGGPADAFVAQLNPGGTQLGFAGYLGGSGSETGIGLAVDRRTGNTYVAGSTDSAQSSFPVRVGPDRTKNGPFGSTDAFVAKIREPTVPRLRALRASPRVFAPLARGRRRATSFRYRLSERARVRFTIERSTVGRRVGRRCRRVTRRNAGRQRCVRFVRVGSLSQRGKKGRNRRRFAGRLRGRVLRPGRYRARAVATDAAGNRSRRRRASFGVVSR